MLYAPEKDDKPEMKRERVQSASERQNRSHY